MSALKHETNWRKQPVLPTEKQLIEAIERVNYGTENIGFCLACGEEQDGCEPDARRYECDICEEKAVYGAEECLLRGWYK